MKLNFQRQAGATLIEIIMVVALISIITIGALVYYNTAQQGSKVSEAVAGVTALSAVIRNQFSTQGSYTGITSPVVAKFGGVPESLIVKASDTSAPTLRHPWNSSATAVAIATETITAAGDGFKITLAEVPANVCADLVNKTYRHFVRVDVGGTEITGVASSATACGTSGNVSISFVQR